MALSKEKIYYLATPYSGDEEHNYQLARIAVDHLTRLGYVVFSPVVYYHPTALRMNLPGDAGFWKHFDDKFLDAADGLIILMLPGWERSVGVKREVERWYKPFVTDPDMVYMKLEEVLRIGRL